MPSVTPAQIKQISQRMAGLGISLPSYSSQEDLVSSTLNRSGQGIDLQNVIDWITGRTGQLRIQATQFAENMVKLMYGLEPDCALPPPGIPVVANNREPRFCAGSIAGNIERCKLYEAQNSLTYISNALTQKANSTTDPAAPYIKRWFDEYGRNDISNLGAIIQSARATCGIQGIIPQFQTPIQICPSGSSWSQLQARCVPGGGGGISESGFLTPTTLIIAALIGIGLLFMSKR